MVYLDQAVQPAPGTGRVVGQIKQLGGRLDVERRRQQSQQQECVQAVLAQAACYASDQPAWTCLLCHAFDGLPQKAWPGDVVHRFCIAVVSPRLWLARTRKMKRIVGEHMHITIMACVKACKNHCDGLASKGTPFCFREAVRSSLQGLKKEL